MIEVDIDSIDTQIYKHFVPQGQTSVYKYCIQRRKILLLRLVLHQ
jgi:hypothetical protein